MQTQTVTSPRRVTRGSAVLRAAMRRTARDADIVRRMADDMRNAAASGGSVGEAELLRLGYSAETIARLGPQAVERANRASVRRA